MGETRRNILVDVSPMGEEMKKIGLVAAVILLFPIAVITYYWWGYKYYSSVIC